MARTPLLNMLLNLSRERAIAERSERIKKQPGSPAIGRRTVLRGAAGIALTSALPLAGLAAHRTDRRRRCGIGWSDGRA